MVSFLVAVILVTVAAPISTADEIPDPIICIEEPSTNSNFPYCPHEGKDGSGGSDSGGGSWDDCWKAVEDKLRETVGAAVRICHKTLDTHCEAEVSVGVQGEHPQIEAYNYYFQVRIPEADLRDYEYESTQRFEHLTEPLTPYEDGMGWGVTLQDRHTVEGEAWITTRSTDGHDGPFGDKLNTAKITRYFYCLT